jgi:hypothetical protein
VWWEEAIPSDNSPKMLKEITTNWKEFEIIFRRAWKIKAIMTSVAWMENNHKKSNESIAAFVTHVQNAVATTSREALTNKANNLKEKEEPKWNDHTEKYLAAQAVYDARAVATHGHRQRRKQSKHATGNLDRSSRRPLGRIADAQ